MSMTYEKNDSKNLFETYEWDDIWIEHPNDALSKRITYIGDSISRGTRRIATAETDNRLLFDGYASSKAVDNPYFIDVLNVFFKQLPYSDTIVFNNGLHGWHLEDEIEYKIGYEKMINYFLKEHSGTALCIALTTSVVDQNRNRRVITRNEVACSLAEKYSLPVIDLYSVTANNLNMLTNDGVHPTDELYRLIAAEIIKKLKGE